MVTHPKNFEGTMSLKSKTFEQQFAMPQNILPRHLSNGLVLRVATPDDREPLAEFTGRIFGRDNQRDELAAMYTRDTMRADHPVIGPSNTLVVEDKAAGKIVSSTILIPQTWTYAGIPFGVGRPEMVATDPECRRRGLVREQFQILHAWSESLGHLVQGITGIPFYYRQFGYEYAIELGGGRIAYLSNIPTLKENESEPYRVRTASFNDIPFLSALYSRECTRSLVACPRDETQWHTMLTALPAEMAWRAPYQIIETNDGHAIGYFFASREIWGDLAPISELAVSEGQSLRAVLPTILRWTKNFGAAEAAKQNKSLQGVYLTLGHTHPAYEAIPELLGRTRIPYGWYIRVPDVPKFLRHIAAVLEQRLSTSPVAGYSGELKISEYRAGYKLVFENGKLVNAETWQPPANEGDCGFPPRVFLQLVFGFKALIELREFFPDAWAKDEAAVLLDALFPKLYSCVCPVA
jgi:hypothetical protein